MRVNKNSVKEMKISRLWMTGTITYSFGVNKTHDSSSKILKRLKKTFYAVQQLPTSTGVRCC